MRAAVRPRSRPGPADQARSPPARPLPPALTDADRAYHRPVLDDTWAVKPATDLAAAIRNKDIKSRELLELYLDRIERLNPALNAVVTLAVEPALAAADAADDRTASGAPLPPLHGLPVTIKDAIETAGIRSTGGAVELTDHVPTVDAPAVARLKDAGAIVFGKTNLPRWSGDLQSFNEIFGTTNNPWDHDADPGRLVGRPGRRGGRRADGVRAGHRHRRLGAAAVALLRHVRAQAELRRRPPARLPRQRRRRHHRRRRQRVRADGPQRRRPRPADVGAGRAGPGAGPGVAHRAAAARVRRRSPAGASRCGSTIPSARAIGRCSTCCAAPSTPSVRPAPRSKRSARRSTRRRSGRCSSPSSAPPCR